MQQVSGGKSFVERSLTLLIRKRFPDYHAVAISNQWKRNLATYNQYLRDAQSLGVRQGIEPVRMMNKDIPALFNVGSHSTFANTLYPDGVWRDLFQVDEIDEQGETLEERIEVRNTQKRVAVYFKRHDLENRILEWVENSRETIFVDGKAAKALKLHDIFHQEKAIGYLDDEIEHLLGVLETRGLVDRQSQHGMEYLYRVETEINFVELKNKLESLEALTSLAKSKGFIPEWEAGNSLSSAQADFQTIGIELDEVRKDSLRSQLNSIEQVFKTQCAAWLKTEMNGLDRKSAEVETLGVNPPEVLKQQTGYPATEFSVLLFQDIRKEILKAYHAIPQGIATVKEQVKAILYKKIRDEYQSNQTSDTAITVAADLRRSIQTIDTKSAALRAERTEAEVLYGLFEKWRNIARQVERDRLTLTDAQESDAVKNLCDRLDEEQRQIKQHLADRAKTVKQVLENHEHFANRINAIKTEFDQSSESRKDDFIRFRAQLEERLRRLINRPDIAEQYNPSDNEGSYQRTREKAVEKIEGLVIEPAMRSIQAIKAELMKPIEVFKVGDAVRDDAIALSRQVTDLEHRIDQIQNDLKPEGIEEILPALVADLQSIREEGAEVVEKQETIQNQLRSHEAELSQSAKKLLTLIDGSGEKDFTELIIELKQSSGEELHDTAEIIKSLEELYQRNWLNIKISRTIG